MYVHRLKIQNLRAIAHLDVVLEGPGNSVPRWCVVTGPNGCGKTTLLQAIALSMAGREIAFFTPQAESDGVVGEQVDEQTWRNVVNGSADLAAVDLFGLPYTHSDEAEVACL